MSRSISRTEILDQFEAVFRDHGYDGVSMSLLAEASGLSRTSLYRHFPKGKQEMGEAAFRHVVYWVCYNLILPLRRPGDPHERLQQVADALEEFYDGGMRPCMIELFTIGEAGRLFGRSTARMVEELIDAFTDFYVEAGRAELPARKKAEKTITLMQGALVLSRVRGSRVPFRSFLKKLMKTI